MADLKISALPASTTPLAGTEVLPIVQSGATKQVSVANLTAGRAISASSVSATGEVIGTTGFNSLKSTASLSIVPTTLFTCSGSAGVYYVVVTWAAGNAVAFDAFAIVIWDGSSSRIALLSNGTQVIIALVGNDVQAVNNFTTATANWSYVKQTCS
jgi:hypothetical protein